MSNRFGMSPNGSAPIQSPGDAHMDGRKAAHDLTMQVTTMVLSGISLVVTSLALYLFIRSRRGFRHDLIMLLIMSDALKSLCFFVFPFVSIIWGHIHTESMLCQTTGFFLAVGLEAADIAVLLIAIHAFISVLNPVVTGGPPNGIYQSRYYAYSAYVMIPVVIASLAFINQPYGYVNTGESCYLPSNPIWPSLILSWIPRFFTFMGIFAFYFFIYAYVRGVMRSHDKTSFRHHHAKAAFLSQVSNVGSYQLDAVQPLPPIAYHGLIPNTPLVQSRANSDASVSSINQAKEARKEGQIEGHSSVTFSNPFHKRSTSKSISQRASQVIRWKMPDFNDRPSSKGGYRMRINSDPEPVAPELIVMGPEGNIEPLLSASQPVEEKSFLAAAEVSPPSSTLLPAQSTNLSPLPSPLPALSPDAKPPAPTGIPKRPGISPIQPRHPSIDMAPRGQSFTQAISTALRAARGSCSSSSTYMDTPGEEIPAFGVSTDADIAKTRSRVFRQLRLMFIYPIVYIGIWLLPFICSMMRLSDGQKAGKGAPKEAPTAPFGLVVASMSSLCMQGAIDAGLFLAREKPWQEKVKNDWWGRNKSQQAVGRSREEMLIDGKIARRRRLREIDDRKAAVKRMHDEAATKPKNWWDSHDDDEVEAPQSTLDKDLV